MQYPERYKTILVIVTGLLVIGLIFKIGVLTPIAAAIGVVSVVIPPVAKAIEWLWFRLAMTLGWINSRILLTAIYFLFLMPIAWLSRLFTKDPLGLKKVERKTMFTTRDHLYSKKDLENIW